MSCPSSSLPDFRKKVSTYTPLFVHHLGAHTPNVNQTLYRSKIEKLQYVVHSRPDIAQAIRIVAILFANPKKNHIMIVKIILRYLKGTKSYGLQYKNNDKFELKVLANELGW